MYVLIEVYISGRPWPTATRILKLPFCRIKDITSVNKTFHISAKTKNSNFSRSNSNFSILTPTFSRDGFYESCFQNPSENSGIKRCICQCEVSTKITYGGSNLQLSMYKLHKRGQQLFFNCMATKFTLIIGVFYIKIRLS